MERLEDFDSTTKSIRHYLLGQPGLGGSTKRKTVVDAFTDVTKGVVVLDEGDLRDIVRRHLDFGLFIGHTHHFEEYSLATPAFLEIARFQLPDLYSKAKKVKLPFFTLLREPSLEELDKGSIEYFRRYFWSLLFFAEIRKWIMQHLHEEQIYSWIAELGWEILEEARKVMREERATFGLDDDIATANGFICYFFRLYIFAHPLLPAFFPAIRDYDQVYRQIRQLGIEERPFLEKTRPNGAISVDDLLLCRELPIEDFRFLPQYHLERIYRSPKMEEFDLSAALFRTQYGRLISSLLGEKLPHSQWASIDFVDLVTECDRHKIESSKQDILLLDDILSDALGKIYRPASWIERLATMSVPFPRREVSPQTIEKSAVMFTQIPAEVAKWRRETIDWRRSLYLTIVRIGDILLLPGIFLLQLLSILQLWSPLVRSWLHRSSRWLFAKSLYRAAHCEEKRNIAQAIIERHQALYQWRKIHRHAKTLQGEQLSQELLQQLEQNFLHLEESFCEEHHLSDSQRVIVHRLLCYICHQTRLSNVHKRILQDMQKSYVDADKSYFATNFLGWAVTFGGRNLRESLPEVPIMKKLRALHSLEKRLYQIHLTKRDSCDFALAVQAAIQHSEQKFRREYTPLLQRALENAGLSPDDSQQERIAQEKIIAELLDILLRRRHLQYSDLRDTISRNYLKLQDLSGVREFFNGDQLLRFDRHIKKVLPASYRRAELYMHMFHRLASLLFGIRLGRWLLKYLILPFGGAYVTIEFALHLLEFFASDKALKEQLHIFLAPLAPNISASNWFAIAKGTVVTGMGIAVLFFAYTAIGRRWGKNVLARIIQWARAIFYRLPQMVWNWQLVQLLYRNKIWVLIHLFLLRPALWSAVFLLPLQLSTNVLESIPAVWLWAAAIVLFDILYYTTPIKLWIDQATHHTQYFFSRLNSAVFIGLFHLLLEIFQQLVVGIESVLYTVDDFFRFRRRDSSFIQGIKAIFGNFWYIITYAIRFILNLIVEPQVNPIKHFPIVTVSHKLFIPLSAMITSWSKTVIEPAMGDFSYIGMAVVFLFVQFGLPGICGFVAWELRENWKLYRNTSTDQIGVALVGDHGETVPRLLKSGFHSGTIPKLFKKLRRTTEKACQNADWRGWRLLKRRQEGIRDSLAKFTDRSFCSEILHHREMQKQVAHIEVENIRIAVRKADIELKLIPVDREPHRFIIRFSATRGILRGYVVAERNQLPPALHEYLEFALLVFLQKAGVETHQPLLRSRDEGTPLAALTWSEYQNFILEERVLGADAGK